MDLKTDALKFHAKYKGKLATKVTTPIKNIDDLILAYTPGVAKVAEAISEDKKLVFEYTAKGHTVAVISDGSAVLGLGNIGALAAIPVMEGKAALFKTFANLDAFPICLNTQDTQEIIKIVTALVPSFGGINLEDISSPRCFEIEDALQDLGIPIMHDDQHGAAIVVLAGLINAAKVAGKKLEDLKVVILGAGAAGSAIAKLLSKTVYDVIVVDIKGILNKEDEGLDKYKKILAELTNKNNRKGSLQDALAGADVFVGVSRGNLVTSDDIKLMAENSIVFAMANPVPEIMPDDARAGGAFIVGTGRSDYPNQINNSLAFPGVFKGALEVGAKKITEEMKVAASYALANFVKNPTKEKIIPNPFDEGVTEAVAQAVARAV